MLDASDNVMLEFILRTVPFAVVIEVPESLKLLNDPDDMFPVHDMLLQDTVPDPSSMVPEGIVILFHVIEVPYKNTMLPLSDDSDIFPDVNVMLPDASVMLPLSSTT